MSEKRSGGRDISELKARLGLKKGAPAPGGPRPNSPTGGVVPPPGVNLPPPPGQRGPQVPNAADDPFGAMNAMAQAGQVQRAPEIVINVNEGPPAEHVGASKRVAKIGKVALLALVPLIIGMLVGAAGRSAAFYNQGTEGAKAIVSHVTAAKRSLGKLQGVLDGARKKGGLKPDKALTTALKPLVEELKPDTAKIFVAKQGTLNPELSAKITTFFAAVSEIQQQLEDHQKTAAFDDAALVEAAAAMQKAMLKDTENAALAAMSGTYPYRYGVLLSNAAPGTPGAKPFGAQVVEIGQPYCAAGNMSTTGTCPDQITGFAYREAEATSWSKGELASVAPDAPVPAGKIVPLLSSKVADGLVRGPGPTTAEAVYIGQLNAISKKLEEVITSANELETALNQKAKAGSKFTFFM